MERDLKLIVILATIFLQVGDIATDTLTAVAVLADPLLQKLHSAYAAFIVIAWITSAGYVLLNFHLFYQHLTGRARSDSQPAKAVDAASAASTPGGQTAKAAGAASAAGTPGVPEHTTLCCGIAGMTQRQFEMVILCSSLVGEDVPLLALNLQAFMAVIEDKDLVGLPSELTFLVVSIVWTCA